MLKILIVEDDIAAAEYLLHGLAEAGHSPEVAPDGREGLAVASWGCPWDLLIVDRKLPRLDGLSMVRTGARALLQVRVLCLARLVEMPQRAQRIFNVHQGGHDRCLVARDHLLFLRSRFPALRAQLAGVEKRLRQSGAEVERRARTTQGIHGRVHRRLRNGKPTLTASRKTLRFRIEGRVPRPGEAVLTDFF
jgi:two-component system OmpR family response regulator